MVHALREIHRVLAPGGTLVDARPESRVPAYAGRFSARGFERYAVLRTNRFELANDAASDRAIVGAIRGGLFKSTRRGRFWHQIPFANLAAFRVYVSEHLRFVHRPDWLVDAETRKRHAVEPFAIRRAVRYEVLRRR